MDEFKAHKVSSALPATLERDAVYLVRVGTGFDMHVTDNTGQMVFASNDSQPKWSDLVNMQSETPTLAATVTSPAAGEVWIYKLDNVTRYRFIPSAANYSFTQDAFYSTFTNNTLSGLICRRSSFNN